MIDCLLISAILCSSDTIAAISLIKYEEQPKLYSIVFGESIVNDAVSIIVYNSVSKFEHGEKFTSTTFFEIIGNFFALGSASIAIGIVIGLLASLVLKHLRFVAVSSIKESIFIFCSGYLAYSLSEIAHMSGIISLLTSGIIMAHYGWYNLSLQGKHVSTTSISSFAFLAEAFVFLYLGLSFFSYDKFDWSW